MKKSISHLPKVKQSDLYYLVKQIKERIPQTEMVILFGSYATGKYVEYDERIEFGVPTSFMSDYDILVVVGDGAFKKAQQALDNIEDKYFRDYEDSTPVQFILEDVRMLNRQLSEGRYFYTQVKQEGVILYDSGNIKLARRRKLNFKEIQQQAQEYYDDKFGSAERKLEIAKIALEKDWYRDSIFNLHQATENLYYTIRLAFTLRSSKQHNLAKLSASVKRYSERLVQVFPRHTPEEKRLFELLKAAYIEARYNPKFVVTKADIEAITPKVELLRDITKSICLQKIEEYGQMQ